MDRITGLFQQWQQAQPLEEDVRNRLERQFRVDFNFNSNHIEGNTLTYGQTQLLFIFGETSGNAPLKDYEEMKAHNVGLEMMRQQAQDKHRPLTEGFIRELNRVILVQDYWKDAVTPSGSRTRMQVKVGEYKTRPNSVITTTGETFHYAAVEETPAFMSSLVRWYNAQEKAGTLSPIQLATLLHYRYIRIHPFEDGNGRIARLLVNYVLLRHDYPMIVIRTVDKQNYLRILHQCDVEVGLTPSDGANASVGQITPFVDYIGRIVEDTLQYDLNVIAGKKGGAIASEWWYNGELIMIRNESQTIILETMIAKPTASIAQMAQLIGINYSAVQRNIDSLRARGYLERIGGTRGQWKVNLKRGRE